MASSAITRKVFFSLCKLTRNAHTSSNNSKIGKNNPFSPKNSALQSNAVTTKRSLQSIAHVKDTKDRKRNAIFDPIAVGARNVSTDPCLSTITLGELREAKHQSQKLQERLLRWIWEGESWSIFAEYDIQITKVKLLPLMFGFTQFTQSNGGKTRVCRDVSCANRNRVEDRISLSVLGVFDVCDRL